MMALIGVLSVALGLLLVAFPLAGALSVILIIGAVRFRHRRADDRASGSNCGRYGIRAERSRIWGTPRRVTEG